jgi:hypothetical protein
MKGGAVRVDRSPEKEAIFLRIRIRVGNLTCSQENSLSEMRTRSLKIGQKPLNHYGR